LPFDATLASLRRGLNTLTRYAVEYRYPGFRATQRRMESALHRAKHIRAEIRLRLNLAP